MRWSFIKSLIVDPAKLHIVAALIILAEIFINIAVVERVPYTEIDWKAYMQECEGFLNGTFDYSELRGDTGPLVYPAGFVYIYSFFYIITGRGENVKLGQYIFIVIYILQLLFVLRLYIKSRKVPPYVLIITILTSYRIHSVYVLRLFNDPVAVLLFYISLNLFINSRWYLASFFYSLAVSVKMNILLYAPVLFFFYLINLGFKKTFAQLFICGILQLFLATPFILTNPIAYLTASFDIGRVFNQTWTVNYRFLDIEVFESKYFHITLLAIHVILLALFFPMCQKYFNSYCRLRYVQSQMQPQIDRKNNENRLKNLKKLSKDGTAKQRKIPKEDPLSAEQESFLKSFEGMLQKSTGKAPKKSISKPPAEPFYSINFDMVTQLCILPMFIANLIGMTCARSLHYQFYSWYFHSLPYLLWSTNYSIIMRFLVLALIEFCWNTYPSSVVSSIILHICHLSILWGVYKKTAAELKLVT